MSQPFFRNSSEKPLLEVISAKLASRKTPSLENSPAMQRILQALKERSPLSPAEISLAAHVALTSLSSAGYLRAMKAAKLIHVAGWGKNYNGFTIPLFALGDAKDCSRPKFSHADRDSAGMAKIVAALKQHGALGYKELAAASGLSPNTIRSARYMDILVEQKRVHICAWSRNRNGPFYARYDAGPGIHVPKPEILSTAERCKRHRIRRAILSSDLPGLGRQLAASQAKAIKTAEMP